MEKDKDVGGFVKSQETKICNRDREAGLLLPLSENSLCKYCRSPRIDLEIQRIFKLSVCKDCRFSKLKFVTKTACQKDYLIQSEELRTFPFLCRPNPHKGSWMDMCLYVKDDIEKFAIHKFGSLEEIEKIKEERKTALMGRKKNKLKARIRGLRKKTLLKKKTAEKHTHRFEKITEHNAKCCECGLVIEEEEI